MVNIGIIGTGFAEKVQLPALRHVEGARVVAVASGRRESAERAARKFDIPHVCDDYRELASMPEVDLVVISSPPHTHAPAAVAAASERKHVLCEKPTALDAYEAEAMLAAVDEAGVLALVDHELRFNPNRRRVKELMEGGYVGEVRHVATAYRSDIGRRHQDHTWWYESEKGGGLLGAIGSHVVDAVRWWLGEIDDVSCRLGTFVGERRDAATGKMRKVDVDDFARFTLGTRSGAIVEASLSSVTPGPPEAWFEIVGSEGRLMLDESRLTLTGRRDGDEEDLSVPDPAGGLDGLPNPLWAPAFVHFAREIVRALEEGRRDVPGAADFGDGLATQRVLDAARRSHAEGSRQRL